MDSVAERDFTHVAYAMQYKPAKPLNVDSYLIQLIQPVTYVRALGFYLVKFSLIFKEKDLQIQV